MSETTSHKKTKTKSSTVKTSSDTKTGDEGNAAVVASSTPHVSPDKPKTDTPKVDTSQEKQQSQDDKQNKGGGIWLTLLILILIGGGGGGGYFLWQNMQASQQRLNAESDTLRQQVQTLTDRTKQLEAQAGQLQQQASVTSQLEQQVGTTLPGNISSLQERQQSLEEAFGKLRSEVGDARTWTIEEIAALLQIANDRLRLEGNVAASLAALQSADQHLQDLNDPSLVDIRRLIAEEITSLQTATNPDITGMALSLDALSKKIDDLPVATGEIQQETTSAPAAKQEGWRGVLHDMWEKVKSLVVIKRRSDAEQPLLSPDERYFLRQNLRLTLASARLALLQRNTKLYQSSLDNAQAWVSRYFDKEASTTTGVTNELGRLRGIDINPALPDISASLNSLQSWLKQHRQQAATEASPQ